MSEVVTEQLTRVNIKGMLKNDETVEVKYRVKDVHHRRISARAKQQTQPSASAPSQSSMKVKVNTDTTGSKKTVKKVKLPVNNDVPYILPTKIKQV